METTTEEKKHRILYVEDNKFDQKAFKRFVEKNKLPYDIDIANSISECKELLKSKSFDIILQDFELKDGNALDILSLNTDEPVVIITGVGNEETAAQSMKENAYDYIIKDTEANYLKVLPSTIENVIKRKKTEKQLKLIRYSIDNASESTMLLSTSGEILFANQSSFKNLEYPEKELSTINWSRICPEMTREKIKDLATKLKEKGSIKFESSYRRKDSSAYPVNILANYQIFGKKEYIFVFAHDITEQKKMEKEKQKIQKLESISILAGGIAHDFNNFLSGIIGNISLAILESKDEKVVNILNEAKEATDMAKNLTKQLLTFSTGGALVKEETSISNIIKETAEFNLRGSNVKCFYSFPENIWKVQADKNQFGQVISNLIINADQAMPEGGLIKISLENTVVNEDSTLSLKKGEYVKLTIEDKGLGIAKKHLAKIFDPYFTTKQKGSGLGLATTYSIIEKHNGYITVDSKLGAGTTFYIYLPATTTEEEDKVEETEEGQPPKKAEGRILLMDDEKIVRRALGRMLEKMGYQTELVADGEQALKKYKEAMNEGNSFYAVILDLTIPGGTGAKETIKKLLELDPEVKAIVSSGYPNDPVISNYRDHGFKSYVIKPFDEKELSAALTKLLKKNNFLY